ncbi:TIGR00366 family protein [Terrabacter sp. NPDC080008]|uniref:TIGR00366 family protein n=1 Tax=Terrabacter sp. NPDC080008 TaxID=3155176 RepID=UPI0034504760
MSHTPDLVLDEDRKARAGRPGPLHRFTDLSVRYVEKWMPDPYLFAVILTIVVVVLTFVLVPGASLGGVVDGWYKGVWGEGNIFTFAMQMILILVGGYTLAEAPLVKRGLQWLASKPRNQAQGGLLCFGVAALACIVNWGLGLVVGALLARQVFARLRTVNFAYLVAAGYMGYMVWTSGLSSSIALANTDKTSKLNIIWTQTHQLVPLSDTIFRPYSFLPMLVLAVVIGLLVHRMSPRPGEAAATQEQADVDLEALLAMDRAADDREARPSGPRTLAERLENLWVLNVLVFVAGVAYFVRSGFALNIGSMVMLFFILGALFHWTPMRFIRAFTEAAKTSGPLLLQYPLYGGIIGLLGYTPQSGVHPLQTVIATAIVSHATYYTLPFLNYVASVVISLFVPSGGGHWGVQGPVAVDAAVQLGQTSPAYLGKISMSVANGEAVANMIQPFWLLPVLAIAKLNIRRVMGFTVVAFVVGFVVLGVGSLLMPLLP